MSRQIYRPQYKFYRIAKSWRFWGFGFHKSRHRNHVLLTIGLGPLRVQFMDWSSKWSREAWQGVRNQGEAA